MKIFEWNLLLLVSFLSVTNCHAMPANRIDLRDDTPENDDQWSHPKKMVDISKLLAESTTIKLEDGKGEVLDYNADRGAIGLEPTRDAALVVESNYGIWGCRISTNRQNLMVVGGRRATKNQPARPASIIEDRYNLLFRQGCLKQMQSQLESWKANGPDEGGPDVMGLMAHLNTAWANKEVGTGENGKKIYQPRPNYLPFITEAAKDIAAEVQKYGGSPFIPLLGPRVVVNGYQTKGLVVRHFPVNAEGKKLVQVFSTGQGSFHGPGRLNRAAIEIELSQLYRRPLYYEDDYDCPFFAPKWELAEVMNPKKVHANAPVAFGRGRITNDISGLANAAGPF